MTTDNASECDMPQISELYTYTHKPDKRWYAGLGNAKSKIVTGMAVAGIMLLSASACTSNITPTTFPTPAQTQTVDVNAIYRSNAQAAILQSVPELANYKSALDYTTQRLTDMKNVYGIQLDQAIVPVSKWVQANIDWEKKGERLVPFSEEIDFMPDTLFGENGAFDETTLKQNETLAINARSAGQKIPYTTIFAANTESIANGHNEIWTDIHDPKKMQKYLDIADKVIPLPFTEEFAKPYKLAIREHGTYADKAQWALTGRAWNYAPKGSNEELIRNEVSQTMILAVGGKAQIAQNVQHFPSSQRKYYGDRQLAIAISPELDSYLSNHPEIFGTPLDHGYLQPELPSLEAAKNAGKDPTVVLTYRRNPASKFGEANRTYLIGDINKAGQLGY